MSEQIVNKFRELIETGTRLAPIGGFDYSGYNARLQNKYLEWRKACLEILELSGPIGFPYKQKILGDSHGGLFYQSSVQLILSCLNELYEKLKASPDLVSVPVPTAAAESSTVTSSEAGSQTATDSSSGKRILKPPPKKPAESPMQPITQAPSSSQTKKVYVIGELDDPLHVQLLQFLHEIGLEEVVIERMHGHMISLDSLQMEAEIKFVFFVITPDDLAYAMFEIGHFVGKLGKNRVCVLHSSDVSFPNTMPGVLVKLITVKLEEASFGLLKDLKSAGYQFNF
ncbi:MAG: nucleotide-binding protein [Ignavibacteriales bacterium]|nr:nucleotide-binding protein [Ignavibacteriales bacterium]